MLSYHKSFEKESLFLQFTNYSDYVILSLSDSGVKSPFEKTLENKAELLEVNRPAEKGDTVNINYVGMKDDVAFEGGTWFIASLSAVLYSSTDS